MMNPRALELLRALDVTVDGILCKADANDWLAGLDKAEKKQALEYAAKLDSIFEKLLNSQRDDVMKRFKEMRSKELSEANRIKILDGGADEKVIETLVDAIISRLFPKEEQAATEKALRAAYEEQVKELVLDVVKSKADVYKLDKNATKSLSKNAAAWLKQKGIHFAQQVEQGTHNGIVRLLQGGLKEGGGPFEIAAEMVDSFPGFFHKRTVREWKEKAKDIKDARLYNRLYQSMSKAKVFESYRASRIARTETIPALNAGRLETWRKSEVVVGKQWISIHDSRRRPAHAAADGQVRALEEPFIVGGEKLMHPGDSSLGASAKNIIQCRCSMKAVLKSSKEGKELLARLTARDESKIGVLKVTKEAIDKVKPFECFTLEKPAQKALAKEARRLLQKASMLNKNGEGYECAATLDLDGNVIQRFTGKEPGAVDILPAKAAHISVHTHPSGFTFSTQDIKMFGKTETAKMMVVIGHNGNIYAVEKLSNMVPDGIQLGLTEAEAAVPDYGESIESYMKAIKAFAERGATYGYRYLSIE